MRRVQGFIQKHWKTVLVDLSIGVFVLGLVVVGVILVWVATLDIPDLSSFEERRIQQSTKIYDRTGKILLYDLHQDVKRTVVPYENISRHIKNATVAIEDDTFFEHSGVRPLAILNAAFDNLRGGDLLGGRGGSTITQQVIKNSILVQEKTLTRKIKEMVLAFRLEQVLTKEEILAHYLNESPYGGTIYSVEEASQSFFGKTSADVTLAEAAYLASLPQLPTYYSPYGTHVDALSKRKNLVLDRMLEHGFITEEEHRQAKEEVVTFRPQSATGILAPHFVFFIRDYLTEKYGEELLAERGLKVTTTLDWELQEKAEKIVRDKSFENEKKFKASNSGLVASDPKTGQILVMVGSRDYFDENIDGNYNIALAKRQPGSSFKPFVYAAAFKKGYTPETVVFDLQTQFSATCEPNDFSSVPPCYSPQNYDGKFRGPINLRNALAQSLNIPAVKVLYLTGIGPALKTARDMGITTLGDANQYGLTLVLGGGEVKLIEMVEAYGVFANEGDRNPLTGILRVEDAQGNVLEEFKAEPKHVFDRDITLIISDILSDNVARTPVFGPNSGLYIASRDVAVKTGTTNDRRDTWAIGYTPNLVVGAWSGNNDNESMTDISGMVVVPLWRAFMDEALKKIPVESFAEAPRTPDNIKPVLRGVWFDPTQLVNTENTSGDKPIDVTQAISGAHSILYYLNKDDPRGDTPPNHNDPQFPLWEYPVSLWKAGLSNLPG